MKKLSIANLLCIIAVTPCHAQGLAAQADGADDLRPISAADWNRERAAHLLERASFGASPQDLQQA